MRSRKWIFLLLFVCMSTLIAGCGKKTDSENVEEIYKNVYENWQEAKKLIYGALIETGGEVTDETGQAYFLVEDPAYPDLESIRKVLESAFSAAYLETSLSWVLEGERPYYKEIDGRLCVAEADAVGESPTEEILSVLDSGKDKIKIKVAADEDDFYEFYEITLVYQGNKWVIDQLQ